MNRPTIQNLAVAAGLSVATVNRVLHDPARVRGQTRQRVLEAAERIGFYGLGSIRENDRAARPRVRMGVLLLQRSRSLYLNLARALEAASRATSTHDVSLRIEHLDDLSPQVVVEAMERLSALSDVIGVVAAEHPIVSGSIETLAERNVPVLALISQLSARCPVGYVGLDNWKVGRTAAWAFDNLCHVPGKLGILVGNHRYRCQETNESGFRSYFREHPRGFELIDAGSTFESGSIARELTERLLEVHPDLLGLYVSGGGLSGVLAALRDGKRANNVVTIGYDLTDTSREALIDGSLNLVISHPLEALAREAIKGMILAATTERGSPLSAVQLPFDLFTSENV